MINQVIFPTSFLPPISWVADSLKQGSILIEAHETYPKQTIRNRCRIANATGVFNLVVPVSKPNGNHTKTNEICIDNSQLWMRNHWRSIVSAYNKSPYFLFYRDFFEPVFAQKHELLIELNHVLLEIILKVLKTNIGITYTSEYEKLEKDGRLMRMQAVKKTDFSTDAHHHPRYMQVFDSKHGFIPDLSIIDLIFNMGPDALDYIIKLPKSNNIR